MMKSSWKNKIYIAVSCLLFIIGWQCCALYVDNEIYIPRLELIVIQIKEIVVSSNFLKAVLSSFYRSILSYVFALIIALILGVFSTICPFFRYMMVPINSLAKTIPTMVLVVLALVWFNKDIAPFIVGFAIIFPILYEGIRNNIMNIDPKIIEMTKIYEVSLVDKITKIYFPIIKFYFISIFVSTLSLTFKVVIAGEVHGQPKYGIGSEIQVEKMNFNTSGIFAWIIIIAVISIVLEGINKILNKKLYGWKSESRN